MPFHYLGIAANVRRYQAFVDEYLQPLIPVHKFITVAAIVTGVAQFIFLYNLLHSRFWARPLRTIRGRRHRSNGARPRLLLLTTLAVNIPWSITIRISMGSRAQRAITSCRLRRSKL